MSYRSFSIGASLAGLLTVLTGASATAQTPGTSCTTVTGSPGTYQTVSGGSVACIAGTPSPTTVINNTFTPGVPFTLTPPKQKMSQERETFHHSDPFDNFNYEFDFGSRNPAFSGANRLGMYVTPDSALGSGVSFGGAGFSSRNGSVGISDTAGLLPAGSASTASTANAGSGGISGSYDASYLTGANQKLILNGAFSYTSSKINFASNGGSINSDTYGFKAAALYANYNTYLILKGSYEFGNSSEVFNVDASTGRFRSDGYNIDARLGHVFMLFNSIQSAPPPRMTVKAPPMRAGGYAIGLDLSGHLGYAEDVARGFTDTSGFVFGDERVRFGETGLRARLFAAVPANGLVWQPYVAGSVDWRFDYSHVANFPAQIVLAGGDAVRYADGTTVTGAQLGLDVKTANGWTIGLNGFYSHTSDTDATGGRVYVNIPFGPTAVSARY